VTDAIPPIKLHEATVEEFLPRKNTL